MTLDVINCIKTCHREQVNNISNMQIAVWTIYEQLCFVILRGGWETRKEPYALFHSPTGFFSSPPPPPAKFYM